MSETKTYTGGCHCGQVRYQVDLDLPKPVICVQLLDVRPGRDPADLRPRGQVQAAPGEAVLTDYQFNHLVIHHLFCGNCGIKSFARGKGRDGCDSGHQRALPRRRRARQLNVQKLDGRSH